MRRPVLAAALAVLLAGTPGLAAAPPPAACRGESALATVEATVVVAGPLLEAQLVIVNRAPAALAVDPASARLTTPAGTLPPLTPAEARRRLVDLGAHMMAAIMGPLGLAISAAAQIQALRAIEARALRAGDVAPGALLRGSVYFLAVEPVPRRVVLSLEFPATAVSLGSLRLACPVGPEENPPVTAVTTFNLHAVVETGPVVLQISTVTFASDGVAVEGRIENRGDMEADVFMALATATLETGGEGRPVRAVRSDFPDRVAPKQAALFRLVFDVLPLPPRDWRGELVLREVRVGELLAVIRVMLRL